MGSTVDQSAVRQAVIDLVDPIVVTLDASDRVTSFSEAAERAFGYPHAAAYGLDAAELFPTLPTRPAPSDLPACRVEARRRDGTTFAAEVRRRSLGAGGESDRTASVLIVHPLEDFEQQLRESEERLQAIIDNTTACIYLKDVEGRYLLVNRRFEELFDITNAELRGKTDHSIFQTHVADEFRRNDVAVLAARTEQEFDEVAPHADGPHNYLSIKFPLFRPDGDVYGVCGISTDITRRKRAEDELAAANERLERVVRERTATLQEANRKLEAEVAEREKAVRDLRSLIDTANEGIWTLDTEGRTTFANRRMAEMLGYTVDEMIGLPMQDFMARTRRAEAESRLDQRLRGLAEQHDFEFTRKDGTLLWTICATSPIRDEHGRVTGALGMVTDITERKRSEERQQLLMRELDHRVKNILATVIGLGDLGAHGARSLGDYRRAFASRVHVLARTHEALARAQWQELPLEEVVRLVLAPHRAASQAQLNTAGASVRVTARATTPLALTLNELGTNALKHGALSTPDGCVELSWGRTGDGVLELAWRESHGPPVTAPPRDGTGLGLIRGLIEYELDGRIDVRFPTGGLQCRLTIPALS